MITCRIRSTSDVMPHLLLFSNSSNGGDESQKKKTQQPVWPTWKKNWSQHEKDALGDKKKHDKDVEALPRSLLRGTSRRGTSRLHLR